MKRKLTLLITLAFIFALVCALASCGNSDIETNTTEEHVHNYGKWITTIESTCTEKGSHYKKCACGNEVIEEIPAKGHIYSEWITTLESTCNGNGSRYRDCFCGDKETEEIPAKGHNLSSTPTFDLSFHYAECNDCPFVQIKEHSIDLNNSCAYCSYKLVPTAALEFTKINGKDEYAVSGIGTTDETALVIPAYYKGLPVTAIASRAFYEHTHIQSVIIPPTVNEVMGYSFYGCTSLDNIVFPMHDITFGEYVFEDVSLESATLPIEIIPKLENTQIKNITICGNLSNELKSNPYIVSVDWIGPTQTTIDNQAFLDCTNLKSITLPNTLTSIGNEAFSGCSSLSSIEIPLNVTEIGKNAFAGCSNIKEAIIPMFALKEIDTTNLESLVLTSGTSIEANAFRNCTSLKSVTISDSITNIESHAFYGCTSLTSVTIPSSVTSIREGAFANCTNLTIVNYLGTIEQWCHIELGAYGTSSSASPLCNGANLYLNGELLTELVLPNNITHISYDFYKCTSLTSITIPDSVTSIENDAFNGCTSLTSITIPSSITSIGNDAFYGCSSLKSVNYSGTIEQWYNTFDGARTKNPLHNGANLYLNGELLTELVIPDNITNINFAFYNCDSLTSLTIGNSVKTIGDSAFYGCDNLTSLTIGNNVKNIGISAFSDCTALTEINFNAIAMCDLTESNGVFYNAGNNGDGIKVTIGKEVTKIPACLFESQSYPYSSKITNVEFEEGSFCKNIGAYAFAGCTSLTSISIPDSVTSIGNNAFYYCNSLTNITIPNRITHIEEYLFRNCTSLTSITIPSSVTIIRDSAFKDCTALTEINFNAKAMYDLSNNNEVFYNAGKNGDGIKVTIGKEVTKIPAYLFEPHGATYSPKIVSVEFEEGSFCKSIGAYAFSGCTLLANITIPDNVTSIEPAAFSRCSRLTSITIPDGVTCIRSGSFTKCTGLTNITIPDSVTSIENGAFNGCTSLTNIIISNNVTSIGYDVFYNCSSLTYNTYNTAYYLGNENNPYLALIYGSKNASSCTINENTKIIAGNAFRDFDNLNSVTIPSSITSIGLGAFSDCSSLVYNEYDNAYYLGNNDNPCLVLVKAKDYDISFCNINKNTKFIHSHAFSCCHYLDVTIPAGVIDIGDYAFDCCCYNLTSITIPDSVTRIGDGAFMLCKSLTRATIPNSVTSIEAYAFSLCSSLKIITMPNNITIIEDGAFSDCTSLTNITIPSSVTSIGENAFARCSSLTSITIPNRVTSLANSVFSNCTGLTSITIPSSITSIGAWAFNDCTGLKSITFEQGSACEIIEGKAFNSCTSLTSIIIPSGVTSIGDNAFDYCTNLTSVTIPNSVTSIGRAAFAQSSSLTIYCETTSRPSGWDSNWNYSNRPVYWYSENEPTGYGNYWHYGDNGEIVVWE